jgi:hypothetical protein
MSGDPPDERHENCMAVKSLKVASALTSYLIVLELLNYQKLSPAICLVWQEWTQGSGL